MSADKVSICCHCGKNISSVDDKVYVTFTVSRKFNTRTYDFHTGKWKPKRERKLVHIGTLHICQEFMPDVYYHTDSFGKV